MTKLMVLELVLPGEVAEEAIEVCVAGLELRAVVSSPTSPSKAIASPASPGSPRDTWPGPPTRAGTPRYFA
jgi:hypothetical protein